MCLIVVLELPLGQKLSGASKGFFFQNEVNSSCHNFLQNSIQRLTPISGAVNSKHTHPPLPPGICKAYMSFFSGAAANAPWWGQVAHTKTPQWGLKSVQMSHPPGQHLLHFPVNELQMPYLTVQYIT